MESNTHKEPETEADSAHPDDHHIDAKQQRAETREVITPYAFGVAPDLFGTPLASPTRRGSALLVDLILVGLLSGVTGNVLAIIIAALLWVASRRLNRIKGRKFSVASLRSVSIILVLGALISVFDQSNDNVISSNSGDANFTEIERENGIKTIVISGKYLLAVNTLEQEIEEGKCVDALVCWKRLAGEFIQDLAEIELKDEIKKELITQFGEYSASSLSSTDNEVLQEYIATENLKNKPVLESSSAQTDTENPQAIDKQGQYAPPQIISANQEVAVSAQPESKIETRFYSIIAWIKGIAADLGLGFGWAAAYFTATMVIFKGQTLGKKLFGIKVIKLDGSTLNVWESFGRYGGYGAGLATGLLGFLQVYWDPNRQAIQDKISETLVIRLER